MQRDGGQRPLDTKHTGTHGFTVTAVSQDGLRTSKTVSYAVVAPPADAHAGNAKLVLRSGKASLSFSGAITGAQGEVKGIPFPGSCATSRICQTIAKHSGGVAEGKRKPGTLTLIADPTTSKAKLARTTRHHKWTSGTLTMSIGRGLTTVALTYDLVDPLVRKVETVSAINAQRIEVTIQYDELRSAGCSPKSSC